MTKLIIAAITALFAAHTAHATDLQDAVQWLGTQFNMRDMYEPDEWLVDYLARQPTSRNGTRVPGGDDDGFARVADYIDKVTTSVFDVDALFDVSVSANLSFIECPRGECRQQCQAGLCFDEPLISTRVMDLTDMRAALLLLPLVNQTYIATYTLSDLQPSSGGACDAYRFRLAPSQLMATGKPDPEFSHPFALYTSSPRRCWHGKAPPPNSNGRMH